MLWNNKVMVTTMSITNQSKGLKTDLGISLLLISIPAAFLSIFAFTFLNPVTPVSAQSSQSTNVSLNIAAVIGLSLTNCNAEQSDTLTLSSTPSSTGTFTSNCQNLAVTTNAPGYALSVRANSDDNTNDLIYQNPLSPNLSTPPTIPATNTGTITSPATIPVNHWGFALENQSNFDTTYTANNANNNYAAMPSTDTTVYSIDELPGQTDHFRFFYGVNIDSNTLAGTYQTNVTYTAVSNDIPAIPEVFKFTIDTRMTDTLFADTDTPQTNPAHFAGTATEFRIPTSGYVGGTFDHSYDWLVNCDTKNNPNDFTNYTAAGSLNSDGITCSYITPGEYQISIKSNSEATPGWMNAFGFAGGDSGFSGDGANAQSNKNLFKSIDTPFTNNMRLDADNPNATINRFRYMFMEARNAVQIPANLFSGINTSNATDFNSMFYGTFDSYAYNSTIATIPSGLFDSIDTSNVTGLIGMFFSTFDSYAYNSTNATIPAGLFDFIDTSNATDLNGMFANTFFYYAYNSTTATILIPSGLFDFIDTSNATNLDYMFNNTFDSYAYNSTNATIPAGLFDFIDTSNATDLNGMFSSTFNNYAYSNYAYDSTPDTDINDIWGNADLTGVTAANAGLDANYAGGMFHATFGGMSSLVGDAQTFINNKLGGIIPDNIAYTFAATGVYDLNSLHANWK